MRLLIIRHGDPDYSIDSLTEKGWREANLLAPRLLSENITSFYCSPLGRAQATAKPTLDIYEKSTGTRPDMKILDWLREFPASINLDQVALGATEGAPVMRCPWNFPPQYWSKQPEFFTPDWKQHPMYTDKSCAVVEVFDRIAESFANLMEAHGYRRHKDSSGNYGLIYDILPDADREQTLAIFCHHGLGTALISVITGIPLPLCWGTFFLPTTSVTTVLLEERQTFPNEPQARIVGLGDVSHLYAGSEPTSSSGLYCKIK